MPDLNNLSQQWLEAKTLERDAMERRRTIELEMAKCLKLQDSDEGTVSHVSGRGVASQLLFLPRSRL